MISLIKDGVERYFFLLELERRLLKMNSGIINNGWIFMQIEKLSFKYLISDINNVVINSN